MEIISKEQAEKINNLSKVFLKIDEGEFKIRILTNPHVIAEHKIDVKGKTKFVICPTEMARMNGEDEIPPCPLCEKGESTSLRYLAIALVRYDSDKFEVGILNKNSIIKKASDLNFDPDFGDVREFDLKVKATGQNLNRRYEINPLPKEKSLPITEDEQKAIDAFMAKHSLKDYTTPRSFEEIEAIIKGEDIPF